MSTSRGFSFWAKESTKAIEVITQVLIDNNYLEKPWPKFEESDPDRYSGGFVFGEGRG